MIFNYSPHIIFLISGKQNRKMLDLKCPAIKIEIEQGTIQGWTKMIASFLERFTMCVFVGKKVEWNGAASSPLIYSTGSITSGERLQLQAIKLNHPIRLIWYCDRLAEILFLQHFFHKNLIFLNTMSWSGTYKDYKVSFFKNKMKHILEIKKMTSLTDWDI